MRRRRDDMAWIYRWFGSGGFGEQIGYVPAFLFVASAIYAIIHALLN